MNLLLPLFLKRAAKVRKNFNPPKLFRKKNQKKCNFLLLCDFSVVCGDIYNIAILSFFSTFGNR